MARDDDSVVPADPFLSAPDLRVPNSDLLELMLDGVMEWIPDSNVVRYSHRWKAQLGYEPHELEDSPQTWMQLSHPDDLPRVRELLEDLLNDFWPFSHAWRMRHQTGQWRWMHCRMMALRNPTGRVARVVGTFTDITERVIAEQRQRALVSAIPDLLLRVRLDGVVLDSKPAEGSHGFGMSPPEVSANLADWMPEQARALMDRICEAPSRDATTTELVFAGAGGNRLVEVRIVREAEDSAVLILRDVTDERRHATQVLHGQKLEAIGQLAAGIAHEINTPAQFVSDSLHFLADSCKQIFELVSKYQKVVDALQRQGQEALAEEIRAAEEESDIAYLQDNVPTAFERAAEGLARIAGIVNAMREFAHPDGRDKQPADLNRALMTAMTIARNEYKYIATIDTQLGEIPAVMCHIGDMNQVFLNIIVNAAHAIADVVGNSGKLGRIQVRTSRQADCVQIEIEDTGPGIPEPIRARVFDPFFTTKSVGRGTGQGLAIARSIVVNKHGGSLSFDTELGKGTTFRILLPIQPPSARPDSTRR